MAARITVAPNAGAEATLALAQRFLAAVNAKDAGAIIETVSEDCVYELHVRPHPPMPGHAGIRQALAGLVALWPDYDFTVKTIFADANIFVADWTMTGTLSQPLPIGDRIAIPDGRKVTFDGVDICPVANGKVIGKSSYVDASAWYEGFTFQ